MGKIVKIPKRIRDSFIRRKISRNEILSYGVNGKIGYIMSGEVQVVRYQEGERVIFPELLREGEFIGVSSLLLATNLNFELETRYDSIIMEIPVKFFKKYILAEPAIEINFLKEISLKLFHRSQSFFIRAHGGTKAYAAYLFYIFSEKESMIPFKKNSEIEETMFSSRTMTYKIIKEFEDKKILRKDSKSFVIKKRESLKEYFEKYVS